MSRYSLANKLAEQYISLEHACERLDLPSDRQGRRNLQRNLERYGIELERVGRRIRVSIGDLADYLTRTKKARAERRHARALNLAANRSNASLTDVSS